MLSENFTAEQRLALMGRSDLAEEVAELRRRAALVDEMEYEYAFDDEPDGTRHGELRRVVGPWREYLPPRLNPSRESSES